MVDPMRIAFIVLALALVGAGYRLTGHQSAVPSVTMKLPPARPAAPRPGFRLWA